jgi:hypothetical protein
MWHCLLIDGIKGKQVTGDDETQPRAKARCAVGAGSGIDRRGLGLEEQAERLLTAAHELFEDAREGVAHRLKHG